MNDFVTKSATLNFVKLRDLLDSGRTMCYQRALLQKGTMSYMFASWELPDIIEESVACHTSERPLNSVCELLEVDVEREMAQRAPVATRCACRGPLDLHLVIIDLHPFPHWSDQTRFVNTVVQLE